jgi:hypothetical protein
VEVLEVLLCRMAVSAPARSAPNATCCTVRGRPPTGPNICRRVSTSFTGRPDSRAAIAARISCDHAPPLLPKPPPVKCDTTRTLSRGMPNVCATVLRTLVIPCVDS